MCSKLKVPGTRGRKGRRHRRQTTKRGGDRNRTSSSFPCKQGEEGGCEQKRSTTFEILKPLESLGGREKRDRRKRKSILNRETRRVDRKGGVDGA